MRAEVCRLATCPVLGVVYVCQPYNIWSSLVEERIVSRIILVCTGHTWCYDQRTLKCVIPMCINDGERCHFRVVVQGAGPGPRYGHVMSLVGQRFLLSISGNDGEGIIYVLFDLHDCFSGMNWWLTRFPFWQANVHLQMCGLLIQQPNPMNGGK
jgi:hypothetical protein